MSEFFPQDLHSFIHYTYLYKRIQNYFVSLSCPLVTWAVVIIINVTIPEEYCLQVEYKVLSSIISNGLTKCAEEIKGNYQNGFRMNRGTIDNIHTH
jgi:hypothetical protein